jgi:hypothetical protein
VRAARRDDAWRLSRRGDLAAADEPRGAEFVNLLSSEANELCDKDKKSTINPEHVLAAMEARAAGRAWRRPP